MNRITIFFFTIMILSCSYSCNEPAPIYIYGNIAGKVTEEGSNNAIEGATIEISGIEQSIKTGSNGLYKFEKLPADNYTIYVSKDGYVADSKIVTVVATQTTQSDFSLLKNLPEVTPSEITLTTVNTSASVELKNTRSADMDFTIQTSQPWMSVAPTHGTIASKNTRIIKITADLSAIDYGEYTESIIINVGQSSLSVPIQVSYYKPSFIEITSPEQGKVYQMGTVLPIIWESNVGGTVKIELVRNGSIQQSIASLVDNYNDKSSHSWGIPALAMDAYQIRISSNESPNIYDLSESFYLEEGPTPPVVSTGDVSSITSSAVIISGCIEDLGKTYDYISQYGHVYSEINPNPTISDYKYNHGTTNELKTFTSEITNLKPNTRYYIRAYAENPKGIAYGSVVSVTTKTIDGEDPWQPTEPDEDGAVDLGLSVKWAACNLGATSPEEFGDYFAWGEVEPKIDYTEQNYKHIDIEIRGDNTYYNYILPDGLVDISGTTHDAATTNWGNGWRIPTKLEYMELLETASLITTSLDGVEGVRVVGPNGNSIFFPAAGYRTDYGLGGREIYGQYWTSCHDWDPWAYTFWFDLEDKYAGIGSDNKFYGLSVRAVKE